MYPLQRLGAVKRVSGEAEAERHGPHLLASHVLSYSVPYGAVHTYHR